MDRKTILAIIVTLCAVSLIVPGVLLKEASSTGQPSNSDSGATGFWVLIISTAGGGLVTPNGTVYVPMNQSGINVTATPSGWNGLLDWKLDGSQVNSGSATTIFVPRQQENSSHTLEADFVRGTPTPNSIVDGTFSVNASSFAAYNFTIPQSIWNEVSSASVSISNDYKIRVYIMDSANFADWQNGLNASSYYNSGETNNFTINVDLPASGTYFLIFDNTFDANSQKNVTAQVFYFYVPGSADPGYTDLRTLQFPNLSENSSITFSENGDYVSATQTNGTWLFNNLQLNSPTTDGLSESTNNGNLSISSENSSVTITNFDRLLTPDPNGIDNTGAWTTPGWLNYTVSGAGEQTIEMQFGTPDSILPANGFGTQTWPVSIENVCIDGKPAQYNDCKPTFAAGPSVINGVGIVVEGASQNVSIEYHWTPVPAPQRNSPSAQPSKPVTSSSATDVAPQIKNALFYIGLATAVAAAAILLSLLVSKRKKENF
jgi:hypothetical protein